MDPIETRLRALRGSPPRGAYVDGAVILGWGEALQRAEHVRAWLARAELGRGDRLLVSLRDDLEVAAVFLGCLGSGVVPIFVDPGSRAAEVQPLLAKAAPRALLLEQDLVLAWAQARPPEGSRVWSAVRAQRSLVSRWLRRGAAPDPATWPACLEVAGDPPAPPTLGEQDYGLVLYTSGTTGGPKLVPLTRGNLVAQAQAMIQRLGIDPASKVMNLMPITHVDGLVTGLFTSLWSGATGVRVEPFTVPRLLATLDAVYKHRATHLVLVPTLLSLMARLAGDQELRRCLATEDLRMIVSTASALPEALWTRVERVTGRPLVNMWGMSEVGNPIFAGPEAATRRLGTIGTPSSCEVLIVSEAGAPLPDGQEGELLLRGPTVTPGYLGDPLPRVSAAGQEWFPTGDLAVRLSDGSGVLRLVGRKKDVIITGGNNVAPEEVNAALLSHPAVAEAATVGLPDETWGERVVSCVVLAGSASPEELLRHVAPRLIEFKVPREVRVLPALPKGRSGKVQRRELVELLLQPRADVGAPPGPDRAGIERSVLETAARLFRVSPGELGPASSPDSVAGWDSMAHIELVTALEREFGVQLTPADVIGIDSLASAASTLQAALNTHSS